MIPKAYFIWKTLNTLAHFEKIETGKTSCSLLQKAVTVDVFDGPRVMHSFKEK